MAETPETNKPDFRNGFPIHDLRDGSMISGQAEPLPLTWGTRDIEVIRIGGHTFHRSPFAPELAADDAHARAVVVSHFGIALDGIS
jgi:hypothetical protein